MFEWDEEELLYCPSCGTQQRRSRFGNLYYSCGCYQHNLSPYETDEAFFAIAGQIPAPRNEYLLAEARELREAQNETQRMEKYYAEQEAKEKLKIATVKRKLQKFMEGFTSQQKQVIIQLTKASGD